MTVTEGAAELLNLNLSNSPHHFLAAIVAGGGIFLGTPYLLFILIPKKYD